MHYFRRVVKDSCINIRDEIERAWFLFREVRNKAMMLISEGREQQDSRKDFEIVHF